MVRWELTSNNSLIAHPVSRRISGANLGAHMEFSQRAKFSTTQRKGIPMTTQQPQDLGAREAQGHLEIAYIEQYLQGLGHNLESVKLLPPDVAHDIMRAASLYASMRLTEVESRSHLVEEIHGGPHPV